MNLADVIRQAAKNQGDRVLSTDYTPPTFEQPSETTSETETAMKSNETNQPAWEEPEAMQTPASAVPAAEIFFGSAESSTSVPEPPANGLNNGSVVRLELFLNPEQLSSLFRALVATQHGMMTLREAANYLRVSTGVVEQMAQEGTLPGLLLEGRWRFPKTSLDEWLSLQVFRAKGETDAA